MWSISRTDSAWGPCTCRGPCRPPQKVGTKSWVQNLSNNKKNVLPFIPYIETEKKVSKKKRGPKSVRFVLQAPSYFIFFSKTVCKKNIYFCCRKNQPFRPPEVPSSGGAGGFEMESCPQGGNFFFDLLYIPNYVGSFWKQVTPIF